MWKEGDILLVTGNGMGEDTPPHIYSYAHARRLMRFHRACSSLLPNYVVATWAAPAGYREVYVDESNCVNLSQKSKLEVMMLLPAEFQAEYKKMTNKNSPASKRFWKALRKALWK